MQDNPSSQFCDANSDEPEVTLAGNAAALEKCESMFAELETIRDDIPARDYARHHAMISENRFELTEIQEELLAAIPA